MGPGLNLEDSKFNFNTARISGSCLFIFTEIKLLNNNKIQQQDISAIIKNVTFCDNQSEGSGGVMYAQNAPFITVNNSEFSRNSAYDNGGAITCQVKMTFIYIIKLCTYILE